MKKVLSLVLVLMLCLAMSAMAVSSPDISAIIANIAAINITAETESGAAFSIIVDTSDAAIEEVETQLNKLVDVTAEEYYGEALKDAQEYVDGEGTLAEMFLIKVIGYDESMGDVTVTFEIPSAEAFEKDQPIALVLGIPNGMEDGTVVYDWANYEAVADGEGKIQVKLDSETVAAAAVSGAMVSVIA